MPRDGPGPLQTQGTGSSGPQPLGARPRLCYLGGGLSRKDAPHLCPGICSLLFPLASPPIRAAFGSAFHYSFPLMLVTSGDVG